MTSPDERCNHSFPVTPPHGSMDQPGDCRNCGITYQEAKAEARRPTIKEQR